jgi:DNA (cytosine-5)-methyltransferase 1
MPVLSHHAATATAVEAAHWRSTPLTNDPFIGARAVLIDFFSGCGGTSEGFRQSGIPPIAAIENNPAAADSYSANFPDARMFEQDVRTLDPSELAEIVAEHRAAGRAIVFSACAPCQPFSRQRHGDASGDDRVDLLADLLRFLAALRPDALFLENVPGLKAKAATMGPFNRLITALGEMKYHVTSGTVASRDHGVPQQRRRLVVLAALARPITFPEPSHGPGRQPFVTVADAISSLPALQAGEAAEDVNGHEAANLSALNLRRIRVTPEGGGWKDWPEELLLDCHRGRRNSYSDAYGRMPANGIAPAMTTRCDSLSNGRFGHPTQDRAITPREAAALQTFPLEFRFAGSRIAIAKQVGNAVPVKLAASFAMTIGKHLASESASTP